MLIKFYCHAYEDVIYFEKIAWQLLEQMKERPRVPGVLLATEVKAAYARLQQGLAETNEPTSQQEDPKTHELIIPLKHRALPLLKLLEAAAREACDVLWDAV